MDQVTPSYVIPRTIWQNSPPSIYLMTYRRWIMLYPGLPDRIPSRIYLMTYRKWIMLYPGLPDRTPPPRIYLITYRRLIMLYPGLPDRIPPPSIYLMTYRIWIMLYPELPDRTTAYTWWHIGDESCYIQNCLTEPQHILDDIQDMVDTSCGGQVV